MALAIYVLPENDERNTERNGMVRIDRVCACYADICFSLLLPVPGGPYNNTPFGAV